MIRRRITSLACLGLGLVCGHADAAEWHRPAAVTANSNVTVNAAAIADAYLDQLGLSRVDAVRARMLSARSHDSVRHHTVRYEQRHHGLPVIGGQAAVRVGVDGAVRAAVLALHRDLSVSIVPSLGLPLAKVIIGELAKVSPSSMKGLLAVWPDDHGGRLVWQVDLLSKEGGRRALVDAHDGTIIQYRQLGLDALGRVYPISSTVTPQTQDLELPDLVVDSPQYLNGWAGNLTVTNYVSGSSQSGYELEQTVVPNAGEDFLYDPPVDPLDASDAFAQVGVYFHLTRMRDFFGTTLGVDMTGPSWALVVAANLLESGAPLDNAFFSQMGTSGAFSAPNLIGIGQGTQFDFAQDSDVFNHEFTHYLTHNAIGYNGGQAYSDSYGLSPFSGSLDEGISDYFACTVNDDPILGEASLGLFGSARDLTDTNQTCPNDIVGEVHADGQIVGSVSWTLRELLGATRGDQLVWNALTLLTFGANFGDFYRGVQQTADDMLIDGDIDQTERDAIDAALVARGLHECDPLTPLRKGEPRTATMFGLDLLGQFLGTNCNGAKGFGVSLQSFFHFEVTPEAGDELVRLSVDLTSVGSGALDWKIYAAVNDHVQFATAMFLPQVSQFDYETPSFTGEQGELVIDASSDPPFDAGSTYAFVVVHQNCPITQGVLTTDAEASTMGTGGAGGEGGGGAMGGNGSTGDVVVDDGCGCRIVGERRRAPSAAWLALALALGVGLRRRRAQRTRRR